MLRRRNAEDRGLWENSLEREREKEKRLIFWKDEGESHKKTACFFTGCFVAAVDVDAVRL